MLKYYIKSEHPIHQVHNAHYFYIIRTVIPATYKYFYNITLNYI